MFLLLTENLHMHLNPLNKIVSQVIKNPVTDHLPVGCKKIGMTFKAPEVVDPKTLIPKDEPVVFVIGAMAHGSVRTDTFILRIELRSNGSVRTCIFILRNELICNGSWLCKDLYIYLELN